MKQYYLPLQQLGILIALTLAGCAVGPDFKTPESPQLSRYSSELPADAQPMPETPALVAGDEIPEQWWQMFASPELSQLVEQGLSNSPTFAAAKARLESVQETLNADTAWILFPRVDAALNSSRQKISGAAFGGTPRIFTVHNAGVDVSYTIDAFGGGQRYLELGESNVAFERFQLEASRQILIANIVTAAIAEASLREQIAATQAMIADETSLLALSEQQYEIGVLAKVELLAQRTALAQTRTLLPALQKALAQMRHQLARLTGTLPGDNTLPNIEMNGLALPAEMPLTLPSSLTQRRPDVRAAEELLHQANAQVGIATANLYPKLALSASYASEVTKFADLFNAGSVIWGLAAGLTQPVFRAGELHARKRAALADFDQAAALYRQSVLAAFTDVADVMLAIEMDGRQLALQTQAEAMAVETLDIIRQQHRQGAISYLMLLDAQRRYQQARIDLVKARTALFNDSAALMFVLGGGWQHGNEVAETMEKQL
ncbi:MAG: hypothetical protein AUJ57_09005 [Zetaproteobacteria bacterium CG1_02_53_45]|nr:MAG: hypothetical protein AUJ57_09005 [Zetaproteobacteria bacterium CG1_02_53_45]